MTNRRKKLTVATILVSVTLLFGLCGCEFFSAPEKEGIREGLYSYLEEDGKATIIDVDKRISGNVVIPDTLGGYPVAAIGDSAFLDCAYMTSLTIPDSVVSIGDQAFGECTYLEEIYFGTGLKTVGYSLLYGCESLKNVHIRDLAAWCQVTCADDGWSDGALAYAENLYLNGELLLDVVVPDGVAYIGSFPFSGYTKLTSITLPDSVTELKKNAFSECEGLTEIDLPDGMTRIGADAFYNCTGLTELVIPSGVTVLEDYVFMGCSNLISIKLPDGLTRIGENAFQSCTNLKEIAIPAGVNEIGEWAFYGCRSLTEIIIPDFVQMIPHYAFNDCLQLTSVVLPRGVCIVDNYAFDGCQKLTKVYHKGTAEDWEKIEFNDGNDLLQNAAVVHNYDDGNSIDPDAPVGPADPNFVAPVREEEMTIWEKIIVAFETLLFGLVMIICFPIVIVVGIVMLFV